MTHEFAYCIVLFDSIRGHLDGLDELVAQLAEGAADTEDEQVGRLARMTLAAHAAASGDHVSALANARQALDANTLPCSHEMVRWGASLDKTLAVVATKLDRVARTRRDGQVRTIAAQLDLPRERVIGFSAREMLGVDELWQRITVGTPP